MNGLRFPPRSLSDWQVQVAAALQAKAAAAAESRRRRLERLRSGSTRHMTPSER